MKDSGMYRPNGDVQGDSKAMPNRGTSTGVTDTYGADLSQGATNGKGSIKGSTGSGDGDVGSCLQDGVKGAKSGSY